ncbi:MAG: hypothetical protein HYR94_29210, partial [Chloroflexi bacterium]|nr:hypothetical protein [Chloroflexota bacterium]
LIRTDQLSYTYRLVAVTVKKQGNLNLARNFLHESLAIAREKQVKLDIVRSTGELAKLEAETKNLEVALQLAKQARLGYLRLRDMKSYYEMDILIHQIEAKP